MKIYWRYLAPAATLVLAVAACGSAGSNDTGDVSNSNSDGPNIVRASMSGISTPTRLTAGSDSLRIPTHDFSGAPSEVEPNDEKESATALTKSNSYAAVGRIEPRSTDVFKFTVEGEPQLWYVEAIGSGMRTMTVSNRGQNIAQGARMPGMADQLAATNLFLTSGTYFVTVTGRGDSEYSVRAVPLGPVDPGMEQEPNDDPSQAHALVNGVERSGYLASERDYDQYSFSLTGETPLQLSIASPEGVETYAVLVETIRSRTIFSGKLDAMAEMKLLLPSGHYLLTYSNRVATSRQSYSIRFDRIEPQQLLSDVEPNDESDRRPLPDDYVMQGVSGDIGADDWYELPEVTRPTSVVITPEGMSSFIASRMVSLKKIGSDDANPISWQASDSTYAGELTPGNWVVRVRTNGPYRLAVDLGNEKASDRALASDLDVSFGSEPPPIAAYWHEGQSFTIPVRVTNTGRAGKTIVLDVELDNPTWRLTPNARELNLGAGQSQQVDVTVEVLADVWDSQPGFLTAIARSEGSRVASASMPVVAECGADPLNPFVAWNLPDALLGGYNVAAAQFGASTPDGGRQELLFDGVTPANSRYREEAPSTVTVDLAGTDPVDVLGFTLHPQSGTGSIQQPRPFSIELSTDGSNFRKVLEGELLPDRYEQSFVLEGSSRATHARLIFPELPGARQQYIFLGEWKVIASSASIREGINIADPQNGGHVVWAAPYHRSLDAMLVEKDTPPRLLDASAPTEWVIGFQHQRAALVERIELDAYPQSKGRVMKRFSVSVSVDSPTGPWVPLGKVEVVGDAGGRLSLIPDAPVWARYVRVSNSEVNENARWYTAKTMRVFEHAPGQDYKSILGEWGHYAKQGPYEYYNTLKTERAEDRDAGDSRSSAESLAAGDESLGSVSVGKDDDWYKIRVPSGDNRLRLDLKGDPTVRTRVHVEDESGNKVVLERTNESRTHHHVLEAEVEAGTYYIKVDEPPRSVAFLWDNSGSVGGYLNTIYQTMSEFGSGVREGVEFANWLPFGSRDFLLENWSDQPYELRRALTDYDRNHSSSNSEEALLIAMRGLDHREGTKAIVMLTDGLTFSSNMNTELWKRFADDRPRVFTLELHSGKPGAQDLMQSWANVDAGYYDYFSTNATLEIGFRRASCHIRRPARYALTATTSKVLPPPDGEIFVTMDDIPLDAVEIILDASGSMLQRIDGKRRIEIARNVLTELVGETIPEGTPMALRIFGHRAPGECQTDLEVPLGPLDKAAVIDRISRTEAKNLAKTPIGASLSMVGADLDGADGLKLVLLITDGEETCDGDPAMAIETLKEKGLDIRVNIVGFAIDDNQLKADFERWATAGGGRYFDASGEDDLSQSVKQALLPKYQVFNDRDELVGTGTVTRDALELGPGMYSVKVMTSPATTFEDVEIISGDRTTINADQ